MNLDRLDWEDLRAFRAVLAEGSLLAAARSMRVTQPTVRRRLDALEQTLGVSLFTRSTVGLAPTVAARDLGRHAEAMAHAAAAFARTATADAGAARGIVRISASDVIGAEVLPPILATLREVHPQLAVELNLSNRVEDLSRQEADIAVRMTPPAQAALVVRRIGPIRLGIFAHARLVARHGRPETLAAFNAFPLVGPDRATGDLRQFPVLAERRGDFVLRVDSHLAQLAAIRAGVGAGICQVALGRRDPDLVHLLADEVFVDMETSVAMHEDLRRTARVRAAFDHLMRGLASYAGTR